MSVSTVPQEAVSERIWARVNPEAPRAGRMLMAGAKLPMAPLDLVTALSVLVGDEDAEIAEVAAKSMNELPPTVKQSACADKNLASAILDVLARHFAEDSECGQRLVSNPTTTDETIVWLAQSSDSAMLQVIADNQTRLLREPRIIASLIVNPSVRTTMLAPIIELAIRQGIDTSGIPGFKELAEAFFADLNQAVTQDRSDSKEEADEAQEADDDFAEEFTEEDGIDDDLFEQLIRHGSASVDHAGDQDQANQSLYKLIKAMNPAQKVRLALVGNRAARKLLIRDTKKNVALTVLRSPAITDKEIATFAANKALHEDVIRSIARTRQWTKAYKVRLALVVNPKCPPRQALSFLKGLHQKDRRNIARNKSVPAFLARAAKTSLTAKD